MQRSLTYQKTFLGLIYFTAFAMYISLSSIYLLLPPMLGLLFYHYVHATERKQTRVVILIAFMLLLFEAEKGFTLFSTLIYFFIFYQFLIPMIHQYVYCRRCRDLIYIVLAYFGFWIFSLVISQVFWMPLPSLDWHVFYYIIIEFLIVSLL